MTASLRRKIVDSRDGVEVTWFDNETILSIKANGRTFVLDRHWLTVPPGEEEEARGYGAKYSRKHRRWYIESIPVDTVERWDPESTYVEVKPSKRDGFGRTGQFVRTYR